MLNIASMVLVAAGFDSASSFLRSQ
uniref:Uncharacterized protein n=1 Tax=Nelumbo nucifera TaxID=4432 RepID=A0A822ZGA8_NELNU|nr:TPA_asm: hypothetical protein HUJ06_001770 [Nelumbo nucifera]